MGSPVSFSGFNKIDFNQVLEAVMAQERQPYTRLETQKTTLEAQNTAFSTLAGKLSTLQSAVDALRDVKSMALLAATSSDTGVGVSTTTGTVAGSYGVVVSALARSQVLTSTSSYAALTDEVATSGTLTLTPTTGAPVAIALTGSTTLQDLADQINAETDSPASASVVQTSPGTYRLMLTGRETGTANGFTVTSTLAGGLGLTFTDTDIDGTYGDSAADNTQTALDAAFTVNSLAITSSSNTVSDVIPGVTLELKKTDPLTTVTIDVQRNVSSAEGVVDKFVTAYNDFVKFAKDQATAALAGKASIGRDPVLQGFRSGIGNAIREDYPDGGTLPALGMVGIGFSMDGTLTLDSEVFEAALTGAPGDVQALFSGSDGTGGAFGALDSLIEGYTQAGGLVAGAQERITQQVTAITTRLDRLEQMLEVRRRTLQREYIAADLAMTRLNQQSSSLSALGGQFRLF